MSQPSKFKNALGYEKKEKYTNCLVSSVSTEGRLIAVNCNFLAMSWNNLGEIVVVDSSNQISVNPKQARIKGHRAASLDLEFSPFSTDLLQKILLKKSNYIIIIQKKFLLLLLIQ